MNKHINNKDVDATLNDSASSKPLNKTQGVERGNKNDSNGSKPNRGKGRRDRNTGRSKTNTFPGNDIAWYERVPGLLETAKQVAYNIPLGVKLKSTNRVVPGIIALDYAPIIGYCESTDAGTRTYSSESDFYDVWASTPFNIAMRNVYSKVRSSKGGSRPYDYPDLAQMLLSAASIYAYIVHIQRVLRCVNRFNFENRYLGAALVSAQGYDYDDLVKNYVNYVGRLNLLVEKAKTVAIPAGLASLDEWLWRNSNIFKDTDTTNLKQQMIIDVPNGYYQYDEAHGAAIYVPVTVQLDTKLSMPNVLTNLETAVASLWNSETFAILMGDLRFAYNNNVITLPSMEMNETVEAVFSIEHAIGVQNMSFFHTLMTYDTGVMYSSQLSLQDSALVSAFTVHQDLRSAELNNGAIYAGMTYNDANIPSHLRGYKIAIGEIPEEAGVGNKITELVTGHRAAGFCDWSFINMYTDIPDGSVLIYATRMKMIGSIVNSEGGTTFRDGFHDAIWYQMTSSSCCFWLGPRILIEPAKSSFNLNANGYRIFNIIANTLNPGNHAILMYGLSNFNIAPKAILYYIRPNDTTKSSCYILGDIEVGTDISVQALSTLQAVCLYSQWLVPDTLDVHGFTPRALTK